MKKLLVLPLLLTGLTARADVTLPALFSEHMVLQQTAKVPIWGKADPGEEVKIAVAGASASAKAGEDGKWSAVLNLEKAAEGPFTMTVEGKNKIEIGDVLIGQVWLASGQSNMEFLLSNTLGAEEAFAQSANPKLRLFTVPRIAPGAPQDDVQAKWVLSSPETSPKFSAVAYYFGQALQQKLNQPIGILQSSYGGTPSEAWTSYEALSTNEELKAGSDKMNDDAAQYPAKLKAYLEGLPVWEKTFHREDRPTPDVAAFAMMTDATGWTKVTLPGKFVDLGLPDAGAVWLVKKVDVKEEDAGKAGVPFRFSIPSGLDQFYWNGEKIGEQTLATTVGANQMRTYSIPANKVKPGENLLAIRLFSSEGGLEIARKFTLPGEWMAKTEFDLPAMTPEVGTKCPQAPAGRPDPKNLPARLFNGMIAPLIPYAIKGAIWYQGENNAPRAAQYRQALPLMISDWRQRWGEGDFPFYLCQLANYQGKQDKPSESPWAELREAQTFTTQTVPNTKQAILIDIGEAGDIHPRNKADVGKRLAAIALADTYGVPGPYLGPIYDSMAVEGNKIRIRFKPSEAKLVAAPVPAQYVFESGKKDTRPLVRNSPNSELEGFAICGKDMQWVWANARIDGDTVIVESDKVPEPVAVRYGWAQNPTVNLTNTTGFPAGPFRTDTLPLTTAGTKF